MPVLCLSTSLPRTAWGQLSCRAKRDLVLSGEPKPGAASLRWADEDILPYVTVMKDICSLQPEAFVHQSLQSRFVEDVEGEFLVGKHGQGSAFGAGRQF
jgi:hypothetical protein